MLHGGRDDALRALLLMLLTHNIERRETLLEALHQDPMGLQVSVGNGIVHPFLGLTLTLLIQVIWGGFGLVTPRSLLMRCKIVLNFLLKYAYHPVLHSRSLGPLDFLEVMKVKSGKEKVPCYLVLGWP